MSDAQCEQGDATPRPSVAESDKSFYDSYNDYESHNVMLSDVSRNMAYAAALARSVKPDDVVIDLGSGTGFLSVLAACAGAKCVIAVEPSEVGADGGVLEQTLAANGVSDRVLILNCDIESAPAMYIRTLLTKSTTVDATRFPPNLSKAANVLVSEWMGFYLIHEGMLRSLLAARDDLLAPNGVLLPSHAAIYAAPASCPDVAFDRYCAPNPTTCGVAVPALAALAETSGHTGKPRVLHLAPSQLTGATTRLALIDLATAPAASDDTSRWAYDRVSESARFITKAPTNAIALWFGVCFAQRSSTPTAGPALRPVASALEGVVTHAPPLAAAPNTPVPSGSPSPAMAPPAKRAPPLIVSTAADPATNAGADAGITATERFAVGDCVIECAPLAGGTPCDGCGSGTCGGIELSTAPTAPPTHWKQTVVGLPCVVPAGEKVRARIVLRTARDNRRIYSVTVGLADADDATSEDETTASDEGDMEGQE